MPIETTGQHSSLMNGTRPLIQTLVQEWTCLVYRIITSFSLLHDTTACLLGSYLTLTFWGHNDDGEKSLAYHYIKFVLY